MNSILTIDSVMLAFDQKKVLGDVFMKFEAGKITSILGRNGAGKTCLMKIISGTLEIENRSVSIGGKRIAKPYLEKGVVAYLPQDDFVPNAIKLKTALKIYGVTPEELQADFPIFVNLLNTKMKNLSGGERRLAETYLVLKRKAKFIMLDEPFSYLAPLQIQKLKEIILFEKKNKGIIITDHMYRDVQQISDIIYLLHNGKSYTIEDEEHLVELGYLSRTQLKKDT
ncbi:MAG TPA: ATP-binding cassette domain-containing protein [Bacteroidia bacterium]|nr:ATP-binding cassette domain-containing protein [Bacteroidia bacterium]